MSRSTLEGGGPTNELEELVWLPIAEAKQADIPGITRTVLEELERRLERDPLLRPGGRRAVLPHAAQPLRPRHPLELHNERQSLHPDERSAGRDALVVDLARRSPR